MKRRWKTAACAFAAGVFLLIQAGAGAVSAQEAGPQAVKSVEPQPCVMTQSAQAEEDPQEIRRIAVLTFSFSSEYWGYVRQGCEAYDASDPSIVIDVEGASSSIAAEEQLLMLETDLESGKYDGFVIAAINREMVEAVIRDAAVPVVAINSPLDGDCIIGGIGSNNVVAASAGARKAADMAKAIGWENPECVMISGFEDDFNNESRVQGFRSGIEENGGVWLDAVYPTDKSAQGAKDAMEKIMADYPDGVGIVACYNDLLAVNALEASLENSAFQNTVFLGFDGNGSVCEQIMTDERYTNMVTVAQNPYEMGFHAVEMLAQHFAGEDEQNYADGKADAAAGNSADGETEDSPQENWVDSGYTVITKVNAQERMLQIMSHLR